VIESPSSGAPAHFLPLHVERTGDLVLPLALDDAFPLFTPEGERAWVEGWTPEYLHPAHPAGTAGTVFRTKHGGEETLWLVLECDPPAGVAAYGRFTGLDRRSAPGDDREHTPR
jgi:hypothetical protein